jgi:hypothetical protein
MASWPERDTKEGERQGYNVRKNIICLVAREYGYKGKEIAGYIQKDPAVVTRYLKERKDLKAEVEKMKHKTSMTEIKSLPISPNVKLARGILIIPSGYTK